MIDAVADFPEACDIEYGLFPGLALTYVDTIRVCREWRLGVACWSGNQKAAIRRACQAHDR
jgi:hypothetical protein